MITSFEPARLASDLEPIGWRLLENLTPAKIQDRYFRGRSDRDRAFEHVHFARAETGLADRDGYHKGHQEEEHEANGPSITQVQASGRSEAGRIATP